MFYYDEITIYKLGFLRIRVLRVLEIFRRQSFFKISDGLDFFFASESNARKLVDFLQSVIPVRYNHSKKLISHDDHSNTFNYKVSLFWNYSWIELNVFWL